MTSKKSILALLCTAALVVGLAACGGDDDDDSGSSGGDTTTTATDSGGDQSGGVAVTISDFTFDAQPVNAGESFEVENKDTADHTFTADDGAFNIEVAAGETGTVDAPADAGTYAYHCEIHTAMTGDLTVE